MLFSQLIYLAMFVLLCMPAGVAASSGNALTITYTYQDVAYVIVGEMLDTCICNATACTYVTAQEAGDTMSVQRATYSATNCNGAASIVDADVPIIDPFTVDCNGVQLDTVATVAISSSTSYKSAASGMVGFTYSSNSNCEAGIYTSYYMDVFYTCGSNTFGAMCNGNQTLSGKSSTSIQLLRYESAACDTVESKIVESFPTACVLRQSDDDDGGDDDDTDPFGEYGGIKVVGYSSSSDDTYVVPKGVYTALIVMIFVALFVGVALAFGASKSAAGNNSGLKERLTQSKSNSDNI